MTTQIDALQKLDSCRGALRSARTAAQLASQRMDGARKTRCAELVEKIEDCIAFTERLRFCVYGDLRADGANR
jgi:hypothetical protein